MGWVIRRKPRRHDGAVFYDAHIRPHVERHGPVNGPVALRATLGRAQHEALMAEHYAAVEARVAAQTPYSDPLGAAHWARLEKEHRARAEGQLDAAEPDFAAAA